MKEYFVIQFNDGYYWCGNNTLSKQIHNAKFFVSELNAEKCVERLSEKIERREHYLLIPLKNAILSGYKILTATINVKEE